MLRRDAEKIEAFEKHVESTMVKSLSNDKIMEDMILIMITELKEIGMTSRENEMKKICFFESSLLYVVFF